MTVRFSPSFVSKERCLSRPDTITRDPRVSDSATFSAGCRQMLQRRNSASPSFHSPDARSKVRGVDATVKFATAAPDAVKRSSGSAVRLPITVMMVSPAMSAFPLLGVGSGDLGAEHGLVQVQLTIQLGHHGGRARHLDDGVNPLGVLPDLERKTALAPDVDVLDGSAALADHVEERVDRRRDRALVEVGIEDEQQFVVTWSGGNAHVHLLWACRPRSLRGRRVLQNKTRQRNRRVRNNGFGQPPDVTSASPLLLTDRSVSLVTNLSPDQVASMAATL